VNTNGKPHEIGYENEPFIGTFVIGNALPLEDKPENHRGEK